LFFVIKNLAFGAFIWTSGMSKDSKDGIAARPRLSLPILVEQKAAIYMNAPSRSKKYTTSTRKTPLKAPQLENAGSTC